MDIQGIIEDIEKELQELKNEVNKKLYKRIEVLEKELQEFKNEVNKKSYKRWRAKVGEKYFRCHWSVVSNTEDSNRLDDAMYELGNYFKTKEEAEKELEKRKAIVKINDRIDELNEGWKPDWGEDTDKFNIYYNYSNRKLHVHSIIFGHAYNLIKYCSTGYKAEQIIKELTPELNLIFNVK